MKYGLLVNRKCRNLGDDIQSYAESLFLPRVDYMVDREYVSDFKPKEDDEVVATIMGAWWMHHKWNFPPPKNILPLWTSIHLSVFPAEWTGTPIKDEMFTGLGSEYLKAHGPIGTRDMGTLDIFNKLEIPAYFSGCVTLTLPKQKRKKLDKEYILLVDIDERVERKVRKQVEGSGVEIKKISNNRSTKRTQEQMDNWEFRKSEVVDLLGIYQNAKCVITRRLHVSLPCLAMEVPVFCIYDPNNSRFSPYNKWLHMVTPEDFLADNYDYDFLNPKPNKKDYLKYRKSLTKQMKNFVDRAGKEDPSLDKVNVTSYTDEDVYRWRYNLMKDALNAWQISSSEMSKRLIAIEDNQSKIYKINNRPIKENRAHVAKRQNNLVKQNAELVKKYILLKEENEQLKSHMYYKGRKLVGKALRKVGIRK